MGVEVLSLAAMACKLAGGFSQLVGHQRLHELVLGALQTLDLRTMGSILALPGTPRAIVTTLGRVWESGLDLKAFEDRGRIGDLIGIQEYIHKNLDPAFLLLPDLIQAAMRGAPRASRLLGNLQLEGFIFIAPCWRPLLRALSEEVSIVIRIPEQTRVHFAWTAGTKLGMEMMGEASAPTRQVCGCASPRHEAVEALRWARELIASASAHPDEIAIVSAGVTDYDDYFRTLVADSHLPVHFVHGKLAISEFGGQQAAALADVVRNGLSQDRVVRALRLLHKYVPSLSDLPADWYSHLPREAPLLSADQWDRALTEASGYPGYERIGAVVGPIIRLMGEEPGSAAKIGAGLLKGLSLALWNQALAYGPCHAVDKTIEGLRVPDASDQEASILWGPSDLMIGSGRKFVRFLGMTTRGWPRADTEDPLLPDRIVPSYELQPLSRAWRDRLSVDFLSAEAEGIFYSYSRRDEEGRLLAPSPLIPAGVDTVSLLRAAVPHHAFSESDRLFARPEEFAGKPLAQSSKRCFDDWRSPQITAHDGFVRAEHPVLVGALNRKHSATSLRGLLTDPLGFLWRYTLGWQEPPDSAGEEPLTLDRLQTGELVHNILQAVVSRIEPSPGLSRASEEEISKCIIEAGEVVAQEWESKIPLPPARIWQNEIRRAGTLAKAALLFRLPTVSSTATRAYVEIPFNESVDPQRVGPWDPATIVELPGTGLQIGGRIDRLEFDGANWARVVDYKVRGQFPRRDPGLDSGKELQRCLYAFAAKQLLPTVGTVESCLLFVGSEPKAFALENTDTALAELVHYVQAAIAYLRQGFALPGPDHQHDDLLFAYPANAVGRYFDRKNEARNEKFSDLLPLWGTSS